MSIQKKNFTLIFVFVLLIALLVAAVFYRLSLYEKTHFSEFKFRQDTFYLPTPIEEFVLHHFEEFWPGAFHDAAPLQSYSLPNFYSEVLTSDLLRQMPLRRLDIRYARKWAMHANAYRFKKLRLSLHESGLDYVPASFSEALIRGPGGNYSKCHLIRQERAYRIYQLWPRFKKESLEYLQSCDAFLALNQLLSFEQLFSGGRPTKEAVLEWQKNFESWQSANEDGEYRAWFAGKLTELVNLRINH